MNKKLIKELSVNMSKDHISESSAQCSYYTILSLYTIYNIVNNNDTIYRDSTSNTF